MNLNEVNEKAWRLAKSAMIGSKPFSNSRVRMMLDALTKDDFESRIKKLIEEYQPQEINYNKSCEMKKKCRDFGSELLNNLKDMGDKDKLMLAQYTQWNMSVFKNLCGKPENIKFMLKCENVNTELINEVAVFLDAQRQTTYNKKNYQGGRKWRK